MLGRPLTTHAQDNFMRDTVDLYFWRDLPDGSRETVTNIEFTVSELSVIDAAPMGVAISKEAAQKLMDDLWNMGIRPRDTKNISDGLNSRDAHIADLRTVNNKLFDILQHTKE